MIVAKYLKYVPKGGSRDFCHSKIISISPTFTKKTVLCKICFCHRNMNLAHTLEWLFCLNDVTSMNYCYTSEMYKDIIDGWIVALLRSKKTLSQREFMNLASSCAQLAFWNEHAIFNVSGLTAFLAKEGY